jgi:hypothetical protein
MNVLAQGRILMVGDRACAVYWGPDNGIVQIPSCCFCYTISCPASLAMIDCTPPEFACHMERKLYDDRFDALSTLRIGVCEALQ